MRRAIERLDCIMAEAVHKAGGKLVKERGEGDSHFILFDQPAVAAQCGVDIQSRLASTNWGAVGPIKVRMAIHAGEAEFRDGDYYGPTVNRCARIRAAAHGGQIVVSSTVRDAIKDHLPPNTGLINLGDHRFKDLQEPETVYQLVAEGLQREFPPLNSLDPGRNNLPVQLTSFVGRERELARLYHLVKKHRLVTLTGAGGSGKTRTSLQSGAELANEFSDGVWFSTLVDLRDPNLIAQQIANALPIVIGDREPLDAILSEFKNTKALIIVDNCEHVVKSVSPVVNRLLRECPHMHVLATSREPLAISGEFVYVVPPLSHELHGEEPTVENVAKLEAVALLRERSSDRLGGAEILTDETAPVIAKLVFKLSGIPLALEQAAANLTHLSPKQLLDRIDKHFAMPEIEDEGVDERHRTIQKTIDWSYRMLSADEQKIFERFSVFDGGATAETAEFVCPDTPKEASDVLPILRKLSSRSLLLAEDAPWGDKRFRMLEPIREFAQDKRDAHSEESLRARHFEWHHNLALQSAAVGLDADSGYYMKRLTAEYNNIRAGMRWAAEHAEAGTELVETCAALYDFWYRRSYLREGAMWLQSALDGAPNASDKVRADALNKLGALMYLLGKTSAAETAFKASLDLWRQTGNKVKIASGINNLALIASQSERHEEARPLYMEAIPLFEASGDLGRLANCLQNLAVGEGILGHLDSAVQNFERAYAIFKQTDDESNGAHVLQNLLGAYAEQGCLLEHKDLLDEGLELLLKLGENFSARGMLEVSAAYALEAGKPEIAAELLGAAAKAWDQAEVAHDARTERFRLWLEPRVIAAVGKAESRRLYKAGHALSTADAVKRALAL